MTLDEEKKAVLGAITKAGFPLRPVEIADRTGLALRRVDATLKRLKLLGEVRIVLMERDCVVQDGASYSVITGTGYALMRRKQ